MSRPHFGLCVGLVLSALAITHAANEKLPIHVPTDGAKWYGNDGTWSTATLRLGNPSQVVYLLAGTGSSITTTVGSVWCNDVAQSGYSCDQRGRAFTTEDSTTWQEIGQWTLGIRDGVLVEDYLQYTTKDLGYGDFGRDTIKILLDQSDIEMDAQTIAVVNDTTQLLGMLGLGLNARSFNNDERYPSFMSSLFENQTIPSRSYGYTAGNYFKTPRVPMDLVLGGTNLGRYDRNNATFSLDANRNPVVNLDSITVSATGTPPWGAGAYTLMVEPAQVMIDSTTPFLWLPESACRAFEQALGLTWNSSSNLYLLNNSTIYNGLVGPNLTFAFTLNDKPGSSNAAVINVPFSSLSLEISWPYVNISSTESIRYFPLKRASSELQYTLGRAFLQEAYLAVDYDRGNFSVHSPYFPPQNDEIETITHPNDTAASSGPSSDSGDGGLSTGAIIGIAVGIGLGVVALIAGGIILYRRRKKAAADRQKPPIEPPPGGIYEAYGESSTKPPYYSSPVVEAPDQNMYVPPRAELMEVRRSELTSVNLDPAELEDTVAAATPAAAAAAEGERFSWEEGGTVPRQRNVGSPLLSPDIEELSPRSSRPVSDLTSSSSPHASISPETPRRVG